MLKLKIANAGVGNGLTATPLIQKVGDIRLYSNMWDVCSLGWGKNQDTLGEIDIRSEMKQMDVKINFIKMTHQHSEASQKITMTWNKS